MEFLPLLCRVIDKDVKMYIFFRGFFYVRKASLKYTFLFIN